MAVMTLFTTLFVSQVRHRVNQVMAELKTSNAGLASKLKRKAWKKFGDDHPVRLATFLAPV